MKDYTIYVTEEIAKKAIEKGFEGHSVSIAEPLPNVFESKDHYHYFIPTAEQICGWLREEKGIIVTVGYMHNPLERQLDFLGNVFEWYVECSGVTKDNFFHGCEKEYRVAISVAINKALDLI